MAVWSIIKKGELQRALRMDAEYYQPQYLFLDKEFSSKKLKLAEIRDVSIFVKKGIFDISPDKYIDQGVPLIRVQNIRSGFLNYNNMVFISDNEHLKYKKTELNEGDLVLSKVGTIGEVAIISEKDRKCNFSQNAIGVKINKKRIKSEYLLLYFLSNLGQLQLQRSQMFQVQSKLELEDIRDLKVVLLDNLEQEELRKIVVEVVDLRESSEKIYSQAELILLEELGLKDLDLSDDLFYTTTLKEVKENNRMDSEYYISKYEKLAKHIQSNFQIKLFKDVFKIDRGDYISPDYYMKKAKRAYIRIKELTNNGSITDQDIIKVDDNFKNIKLKTLKEGDFVFAAIGATLGKVNRISSKYENSFFSNNTARFRLKKEFADYNTYFVEALLRSPICQLEFERRKAQTAQAKISNDEIGRIFLPLVRKEIQFKVAKYIEASYKKNTKAKNLLEQAINKVEEMIEKEARVK